jgi:hypothetical protein
VSEVQPSKTNAALWSAHLTNEWDAWLGLTHMESTRTAERTGAMIAAVLSPWLALLTARRSREEIR